MNYENDKGELIPKIKISENAAKITNPSFKKVYRIFEKSNGMAMADYMGTAFNEETTAKWIKRTIDDVDKPDGFIFNRWYADMCFAGEPIDWEMFV